ncbi:MAG: glycosyltransferase family 2 protein [Enterococcus casseliflavus]
MKISVIVPTYNTPVSRLEALVNSVQNQTMDSNDYEIIFIDDGSTEGTFYHIEKYIKKYNNVFGLRISNSGWGSRPRNIGIKMAKGDFVLFMDHDDVIYPQAFERSYEYAISNDLDIVNPKEVRTDGWSWGWEAFKENKINTDDISMLIPMTPHKFYKRKFLIDNKVFFKEGRRILWEDVYFNVLCYSKKPKVGVLSDYPIYHWVTTKESNYSTFDRDPNEYWHNFYELCDFFVKVIDSQSTLSFLLTHWYRNIVLGSFGAQLQTKDRDRITKEFSYATRFREKYLHVLDFEELNTKDRIRDYLLKKGDIDTLIKISLFEKGFTARSYLEELYFFENKIYLKINADLTKSEESLVEFKSSFPRKQIKRSFNKEIEKALPKKLLIYTDNTNFNYDLSVKGRNSRVTWDVKNDIIKSEIQTNRNSNKLTISAHLECKINLEDYIHDIEDSLQPWDIAARFSAYDFISHRALAVKDPLEKVAYINGNSYVAYKNKSGLLSIDLNNSIKNFFNLISIDVHEKRVTENNVIIPISGCHIYGEHNEDIMIFLDPIEPDSKTDIITNYPAQIITKDNEMNIFIPEIGNRLAGRFKITINYKGKNSVVSQSLDI